VLVDGVQHVAAAQIDEVAGLELHDEQREVVDDAVQQLLAAGERAR
jgi:hypothetical protein